MMSKSSRLSGPDGDELMAETSIATSKRAKLLDLTKASVSKLGELKSEAGLGSEPANNGATLGNMDHDPAFKMRSLHEKVQGNERQKKTKPVQVLKDIGKGIAKPKKTIKKQATKITAGKLSTVERSFLSKQADVEYLEAHDDLVEAEGKLSAAKSEQDFSAKSSSIDQYHSRVQKLERERESLHVAWITSHQVTRVRVVPSTPYQAPKVRTLSHESSTPHSRMIELLHFLGHVRLLPFRTFSQVFLFENFSILRKMSTFYVILGPESHGF